MTRQSEAETVILVHGLWMTGAELLWLGGQLEACGFAAGYFRYRSWRGTLDVAALELRRFAERQDGGRVHLLGHSLGGLVIARMLEEGDLPNLGRIVLLGSPQQGSQLASALERFRAGRFILGPVAAEGIVRNRPASLAVREPLVIAGTLPFGFSGLFGVAIPNDGTVAATETEVPGASTLLVRASHMGMLFSRTVAEAVCNFLREGKARC